MKDVTEVGVFSPKMKVSDGIGTGSVGYIACSIKTLDDVRVGDTITLAGEEDDGADPRLPGAEAPRVLPVSTPRPPRTSRSSGRRLRNCT